MPARRAVDLQSLERYVKGLITASARLRRELAAKKRMGAANVPHLLQYRLSLGQQLASTYQELQRVVADLEVLCLEARALSRSHSSKKVCGEHAVALKLMQNLAVEL